MLQLILSDAENIAVHLQILEMHRVRGKQPQQMPCAQEERQHMTFLKGHSGRISLQTFQELISNCYAMSLNYLQG